MREYCGETFSKLDRAGEGLSSRLFEDCLFTGCRLEGALVENCQFSGCRFEGCKITAPKFRATQMLSCDFADCALSGVDWSALLDTSGALVRTAAVLIAVTALLQVGAVVLAGEPRPSGS